MPVRSRFPDRGACLVNLEEPQRTVRLCVLCGINNEYILALSLVSLTSTVENTDQQEGRERRQSSTEVGSAGLKLELGPRKYKEEVMTIRRRLLTLGGLGALISFCLTGCTPDQFLVSSSNGKAFPMERNPHNAIRMLKPRGFEERLTQQAVYEEPVSEPVPSMITPTATSNSSRVGGVAASTWRGLDRGSSYTPSNSEIIPTALTVNSKLTYSRGTTSVRAPLVERRRTMLEQRWPDRKVMARRAQMTGTRRMMVQNTSKKLNTLPTPKKMPVGTTAQLAGAPVGHPIHAPVHAPIQHYGHLTVPREGSKVALPTYRIEPPDILLIEVSRKLLPEQPVQGSHLVRPDGTVNIGVYGSAYVAGMTLDEAKVAVRRVVNSRLDLKDPDVKAVELNEINVDVLAYNSKVYYVITDGGGLGEQVYRIPTTGNETVLDALAQINGLPAVASKKRIWLARPNAEKHLGPQILPIHWNGITREAVVSTNYQVYPGDRIYVASDPLITFDTVLGKVLSPIDRFFGSLLLGSSAINSITGRNNNNNNNRGF